jgi:hypothetical protein
VTHSDALAVSKSIWRYLHRALAGGELYGVDWPTLRVLYPQIAKTLKECYRVLEVRP